MDDSKGYRMNSQGLVSGNKLEKGNIGFLIFICVVASMGGLLFGYDTVVIAGTISPVKAQFAMTDVMEGFFVSAALWGCALGVALSGCIIDVGDRYGRKWTMIGSAVLLLISALGCGIAPNVSILIIARLIGGVGVGLASMASPLYISEVSPAHLRGRMVSLFQLTICIGILVAMFVNTQLQAMSERLSEQADEVTGLQAVFHFIFVEEVWRSMFAAEILPAIGFLILCLVIPKSPRWLVTKGRFDDAMAILKKVRGNTTIAEKEMGEIRETVSHESSSAMQLFHPGLRKALFVGFFLAIFSELSGITIVMYYGPSILEDAGFTMGGSLSGHFSIGVVLTVFTMVAVWLIDIVGRRPLMLIGNTGAFLGLVAIGLLFATGRTEGITIIVMMCLFVACFSFSLGPIKWVVMSEIFPTKIRGRAVALATLALWMTDVFLNHAFPVIRDRLGVETNFFLFACFLIPQFFFVWKIMPETKGRTLEEIEQSWRKSVND